MIHARLIRAIFCLLLTSVAVNSSSAFGQEQPGWMAEIRRAWQARQEAVRTLQVEIESQKRFVGNRSTLLGSPGASHKVNQLRLSLSDNKFSLRTRRLEVDGEAPPSGARPSQSTFDGAKSWYYTGTSKGSGVVGSGAIESTPYEYGANLVDLKPVLLAFRPLNSELTRFDLDICDLESRNEVIEGHTCWLIKESPIDGWRYRGLWLDIERGFLPVRYQKWNDDRPSITIDIQYVEQGEAGWMPERWEIIWVNQETGAMEGSFNCRVTDVSVNEDIPDSVFAVRFPVGTHVSDRITGTSYVQEPRSRVLLWVTASVVIALLALLVLALRRPLRRFWTSSSSM